MINKLELLNSSQTEIEINEEKWTYLKENYDKEVIKKALSEIIDEFELDMPLNKITLEDATDGFSDLLNLDTTNMIKSGNIFTR